MLKISILTEIHEFIMEMYKSWTSMSNYLFQGIEIIESLNHLCD